MLCRNREKATSDPGIRNKYQDSEILVYGGEVNGLMNIKQVRIRAVAEELKIRCLDSQNWEEHLDGDNSHAPSGEIKKRFSEFLAISIESLGI